MNFDSLQSVLLGDHTWADELSMDEMSAVRLPPKNVLHS
jgi:hypothetical protein